MRIRKINRLIVEAIVLQSLYVCDLNQISTLLFFSVYSRQSIIMVCPIFFSEKLNGVYTFFYGLLVKLRIMRRNWYLNSVVPSATSQVCIMCHTQLDPYQLPFILSYFSLEFIIKIVLNIRCKFSAHESVQTGERKKVSSRLIIFLDLYRWDSIRSHFLFPFCVGTETVFFFSYFLCLLD